MKLFERKLILTDLDGTYLFDDHHISKENRAAVRYFMDNGGLFTVATGRSKAGMEHFFPELEINAPAIIYNGSVIYDFVSKADVLDTCVGQAGFGLYKALDEKGIAYAKTAVGDKYVYEYMVENGCRLGGEQSGHIIISKYATTGDGILTSLKLMEVMLAMKKPMSQLTEGLKIYPQVLRNVRVRSKPEAQNDPNVQAAVEAVANQLGDTGRILVRESGTEPVIRVMVEAPDEETCKSCVDYVVDVICRQGHAKM